jgi:hypothetical protein
MWYAIPQAQQDKRFESFLFASLRWNTQDTRDEAGGRSREGDAKDDSARDAARDVASHSRGSIAYRNASAKATGIAVVGVQVLWEEDRDLRQDFQDLRRLQVGKA